MKAELRTAAAAITAAVLILAMAAFASAVALENYSADYNVLNGVASVNVTIALAEKVSGLDWTLPADASGVAVEGLSFRVSDMKSFKRLQIDGQPFDKVSFTYSTSSVLEKTGDSFFILDLAGIGAADKFVTVRLPSEATLKYALDSQQSAVIPKTGSVMTDGKRIKISWNETSLVTGDTVLVIYKEPGKFNPAVAAAAVVLLLGGAAAVFYRRNKSASEKDTHSGTNGLTRNLFEDEKKIVELLLTAGEEGMWQKKLEIKSGISKVKLSRKLRSLDQKGLIEKIPYGNANKIRLKKA